MEKNKNVTVLIDGDPALRKGVYANISMAKTTSKETILDFAMVDSADESGKLKGILQSRVIMSNEAFVEFAEMVAGHFAKNFERVDDDE